MKKLFVIGMAVLLLVVFTMPAMAKVKIGGIVFTDFYYINRDSNNAISNMNARRFVEKTLAPVILNIRTRK